MDIYGSRASLLSSYQEIIEQVNKSKKQKATGQVSLFGELHDNREEEKDIINIEDFSKDEKLAFEKEFLGIYLTSHPQMANLLKVKSETSHTIDLLEEEIEGQAVKVGGIIETTRKIFTKKTGAEMAFISIGDEKGLTVECVIFPKIYDRYRSLINKDSLVVIEGKIDTKNDRPVIIAEKLSTI
jgi:DNA polymerase-3 subunit alpha